MTGGTKRFDQIDRSTGEIQEGFVAVIQPKRKNGFQETGWIAMNQQALSFIAQSDLTGNDLKVLFQLLTILDFENLIQVSQAEVALVLGMNKQHVSRSIKNLVELGVIHEGPKIGRSKSYRLDPEFGWKGSAKLHKEALKQKMKKSNMTVVK